MSVSATCSCGKTLRAKDEAAGKRIKCPACGNPISFPELEPEPDNLSALNIDLSDNADSSPHFIATSNTGVDTERTKDEAETTIWHKWMPALRHYRRSLSIGGSFAIALLLAIIFLPSENPEYQGKRFSDWKHQLNDLDPQMRVQAIKAIGAIGRNGHAGLAIPVLSSVLADNKAERPNIVAAGELAMLGNVSSKSGHTDGASRVLSALIVALGQTKNADLNGELLYGIKNIVFHEKDISDGEKEAVFRAVKDFVYKPEYGGKVYAVPVVAYFTHYANKRFSAEAVTVLGRLMDDKAAAQKVVPLLISFAEQSYDHTPLDLKPALPQLIAFVERDFNNGVDYDNTAYQEMLMELLVKVGPPEQTVPMLVYVVQHKLTKKYEAIKLLGKMGPKASSSIPVLTQVMAEEPTAFAADIQKVIQQIQGVGP